METFLALTQIIPPPESPVYNGCSTDWQVIEGILEMELPSDFKKLINVYGTGGFLGFLYPLSPFAPFETNFNMLSGATRQLLSAYKSGQKEFPKYAPPFPAYPHKSGLFPWGITIHGHTLFWLREGQPEKWSTVVCDSKFSETYDQFNFSVTEFLFQLFSGKTMPGISPEDLLALPHVFKPYVKGIS